MKFFFSSYSLAFVLTVLPFSALAANSVLQQEQLEQVRQNAALRESRLQSRPVVSFPETEMGIDTAASLPSGPSFFIRHVVLEIEDSTFSFLSSYIHDCENKKVNLKDINQVVHKMNEELLRRGYVTSRVIIPEQNIAGGTLRFHVQVGRIHQVRYSEGSAHLPWRTSFPIWESDILNVHLLEQGIEQMKRLSSQDVHMELVPTDAPGESDIVLTIQRTSPVHGILSIDDSGLSETGSWQLSAGLGIDNLFYANDYLQVDLNGDGVGYADY